MRFRFLILFCFSAVTLFAQALPKKNGDWPSYDGVLSGNRYSTLNQITSANVSQMSLSWTLPVTNPGDLEVTPLVISGVLYGTGVNQVYAVNAETGQLLWRYLRPQSGGLVDDAAEGINRGVAISGNYVIFATDNAHLVALNRTTGALLWETVMADSTQNYGATAAPLVVGNVVIAGHSGGDDGVRGFLAGYNVANGQRLWTLSTIPFAGDAAASTWGGFDLNHACGATWMTGTYDNVNDILYWTTGNPCPDYNGDDRPGDNLYTSSVLAIRPLTGRMVWSFQFTPHDTFDFDAQQTPMVLDAAYGGAQRKLLALASRNGFFYLLDRLTGQYLRATPFVSNLTWATSIGANGRPNVTPGAMPSTLGTTICPASPGAANWMSNAFNPATGFYYVMATESCATYHKYPDVFMPGATFYGGDAQTQFSERHVRAINLQTGAVAWDKLLSGPGRTRSGMLTTSGGLVFYGDDNGAFTAVDAGFGNTLWSWPGQQSWHASPMTYMVNGKQYVAIAAPTQLMVFALR